MAKDQQSSDNADKKQEQSSGWWTWSLGESPGWLTANPSEFPAEESSTSQTFFDNPPLLFMTLMWAFPYTYMYLCLFEVWGIASVFKLCGARVSDYISQDSLSVFAGIAPLLFVVMLLVKSRWFLKNFLVLLLVWFVLTLTSGLTQGALTLALSKAYCAGN